MNQDLNLTQGDAVTTQREEARHEMALVAQVDDATRRVGRLRNESSRGGHVDVREMDARIRDLTAARTRLERWRAG